MILARVAALLAADPSPAPTPLPPPIDPDRVSPGLLGLASFLFLVLVVVLLWRGLNRQLGRIDFDDGTDPAAPAAATDPPAAGPEAPAAPEPSG